MLDTRRKPSTVPVWKTGDDEPSVPAKPSFGLGSLRNRKKLLVFSTVAFFTAGLLYAALKPTTYTAASELLIYIKEIHTGADLAILPGRADLPLVQNQIELLRSGNVLTRTVEALKLYDDAEFTGGKSGAFGVALLNLRNKLKVRQVGTSHMVTVSFKASEPAKAARVVNTVIRMYLQELAHASDARSPTLRELYQSLGPSAFIVSEAQPPTKPSGLPMGLIAAGAAIFGFCVGAAVALLCDALDDKIRSAGQVEHALGMECLGTVSYRADSHIVVEDAAAPRPYGSTEEELRRLSATMLEASLRGVRTLGVTSTIPGEGATAISIMLAQTIAAAGKRVLLIDAVPDNCSVSRWVLDLSRMPAAYNADAYSSALDGAVEVDNELHVLPLHEPFNSGVHSTGPVLSDGGLEHMACSYDFVIVDMPALASGPQVRASAQLLDSFLLVVKWGATESELVRQALQSSGEARSKFVGAVLNMADISAMRKYGYVSAGELKVTTAS